MVESGDMLPEVSTPQGSKCPHPAPATTKVFVLSNFHEPRNHPELTKMKLSQPV
jgi:hypothetical protein